MKFQINEHHGNVITVITVVTDNLHNRALILNHDEQRELLEALARAHGFTLVDREERKSLLALTEEVDEDVNDYDPVPGWIAWQDRAEALAAAVNQALRVESEV